MKTYAVVDGTGLVVNVVNLESGWNREPDPDNPDPGDRNYWTPPPGHSVVQTTIGAIGYRRVGTRWIRPDPVPAEPTEQDIYAAASDAERVDMVARKVGLIA